MKYTNVRRRLIWSLVAFVTTTSSAWIQPAHARSTYPERQIRLIVPYPAGGGADLLGRLIGQNLTQETGMPVVVENKPGANGALGAAEVAKASPDGYSLVLVTDGLYSILPHFLKEGQANPLKHLTPVISLVDAPLAIATRPGLGVNNLAELIALAKREPGKLTYGANNTTSTHYFAMQVLQKMAGIKLLHIPFAGTSAAVPLLMNGELDLLAGQVTALNSSVESNRGVKYIAVTTAQRFPLLPNVPAAAETLPGYDEPVAMGLMTTAGTPPQVVETINMLINKILKSETMRKSLLEQSGAEPTGGTVQDFAQLIDRQLAARAQTIASSHK